MTVPAADRPGGLVVLAALQMTTFALPVIRVFQIKPTGLRPGLVAGLTFLYRLSLLPEISPLLIFMMANNAIDPGSFVAPMAKNYRGLLPGF